MLDPADYSVVVKIRPESQKPWRWMIHRAGVARPVHTSKVYFQTMSEAQREGKKALESVLVELRIKGSHYPRV